MTTKEFEKKVENGEAQYLTTAKATELKGKKIAWMYFGYEANEPEVYEMTVGEIKDGKLYRADGTDPFIIAEDAGFDEPTFTCSDSDRPVFFVEL